MSVVGRCQCGNNSWFGPADVVYHEADGSTETVQYANCRRCGRFAVVGHGVVLGDGCRVVDESAPATAQTAPGRGNHRRDR